MRRPLRKSARTINEKLRDDDAPGLGHQRDFGDAHSRRLADDFGNRRRHVQGTSSLTANAASRAGSNRSIVRGREDDEDEDIRRRNASRPVQRCNTTSDANKLSTGQIPER
jgi:hypothetical protein